MSPTQDLSQAVWRKSSYSDGTGGSCVEVADGFPGVLPVRDSKVPDGPALFFRRAGWDTFVTAVRHDEL